MPYAMTDRGHLSTVSKAALNSLLTLKVGPRSMIVHGTCVYYLDDRKSTRDRRLSRIVVPAAGLGAL